MGSAPNNGGGFGNVHPGSLGSVGFPGSPRLYPSDLSVFPPARGNYRETMFSLVSTAGFPSLRQMINGRNPMAQVSASYDATNDRMKSRKHDGNNVQPENKRQFELDIERIAKGEDSRTTLMIKNIPNKYVCTSLFFILPRDLFFLWTQLMCSTGIIVSCFWPSLTRTTAEPMILSTFRLTLRYVYFCLSVRFRIRAEFLDTDKCDVYSFFRTNAMWAMLSSI
jgi:hypothetical protein